MVVFDTNDDRNCTWYRWCNYDRDGDTMSGFWDYPDIYNRFGNNVEHDKEIQLDASTLKVVGEFIDVAYNTLSTFVSTMESLYKTLLKGEWTNNGE